VLLVLKCQNRAFSISFPFVTVSFRGSRGREAPWPLNRPPKVYGTGDKNNKDEKSVNGTQISIVKFPPGKRDYLSGIPNRISGIFWYLELKTLWLMHTLAPRVCAGPEGRTEGVELTRKPFGGATSRNSDVIQQSSRKGWLRRI